MLRRGTSHALAPRKMRPFSWVLAFVAAVGALVVFEAPARAAETVTITTTGIVRRSTKGTALTPRIINGVTQAVSHQDCLDDISIGDAVTQFASRRWWR